MESYINIGSVWVLKENKESMAREVCVIGVNRKMRLVFLSGMPDMVQPIISFEYLIDTYDVNLGWNTVA